MTSEEYERRIADLENKLEEEIVARRAAEYEAKRIHGLLKVELNNNAQAKRAFERKEERFREKEKELKSIADNPEGAWRELLESYKNEIRRLAAENRELWGKLSRAKEALR
jgi:hypothetical protein